MKNKLAAALMLALAILLAGCPRDQYIVEMTPGSDSLERVLTFYRQDGTDANGVPKYEKFPEDRRQAIVGAYPPRSINTKGKHHTISGAFAGAMPNDVGGAGSWTNIVTTFGSAAFYVERFRGNDDLLASATRSTQAADELMDLWLGWSKQEFGAEPGYSRLRQFLDQDMRRDLKNLVLYSWVQDVAPVSPSVPPEEFYVRIGQYLAERDYFQISQVPELYATFASNDQGRALEWIRQFMGRKMGLTRTDSMPASFTIFTNASAFEASWTNYVARSDFFQRRTQRWQQESHNDPDLKQPSPSDALNELFTALISFQLFGEETDDLKVRLNLPAEPIRTNGKWDGQKRQVSWEAGLGPQTESRRLPVLCYATWVVPDAAWQEKHFGRVVLTGDSLLAYCLWRADAADNHAAEWDAFVAGLTPEASLVEKLEAFRFADESGQTEPETKLASQIPRQLLKSALEGEPSRNSR